MTQQPPIADQTRAPKTQTVLAFAIVILIAGTLIAVFTKTVPEAAKAILEIIVGVLISKFGTVYDFYFGGSKGGEASKALAASAIDKLPSGDAASAAPGAS